MVTDVQSDHITIQKFIGNQLRSRSYRVKYQDIYKASPSITECPNVSESSESEEESSITITFQDREEREYAHESDESIEEQQTPLAEGGQIEPLEGDQNEPSYCPICFV